MPAREALLSRTFVQLADTLVDEFDIIDLLTVLTDRCVELLGAAAAGILLADHEGGLHVMAASSEQVRLLELFQLQNHEGPCLDCFSTGHAAVNQDLALSQQWPRFAPMALAAGFCAVHALPMRLRDNVIGALNVFMGDRLVVTDDDLLIAQALADASTIAILQDQAVREAQVVANQLNGALTSRIAIEQAKGILAERAEIDMQEAFSRLRRYARDHNRQLSLVATELINGTLPGAAIANLSRHDQRELTK
ncbi:MAG: GAF and ANTAR domain-containing protein [Actinobacteria bacterium]|nr:MAG: GAF and ANTAR domain-containing protein [Actinomycetota bacterium]